MDNEIIDNDEELSIPNNNSIIYPGIIERMKALISDSVVIVCLMLSVGVIFSNIENVPNEARMIVFVIIFLIYDSLFTSLFGGTIGHLLIGIRVRRDDESNKNIIFPMAILRYCIKAGLGWVSLLTISRNLKGKAIHDLAVNSIVVYKNY